MFVAETAGRREIFDEMLRKAGIHAKPLESFQDYKKANHQEHYITVGPLAEGLWSDHALIVTETEVLGARQSSKTTESAAVIDTDQIVRNLTELSIGAPVVHTQHGVGRYLGLDTLDIDDAPQEFLTLSYAGGAKLYVPVTSLHLIGRYAGAEEELAHCIGLAPISGSARNAEQQKSHRRRGRTTRHLRATGTETLPSVGPRRRSTRDSQPNSRLRSHPTNKRQLTLHCTT